MLQCVAVCCSGLQCAAVCCTVHFAHYILVRADMYNMPQVCCSVLQCVAVCCSVLHRLLK